MDNIDQEIARLQANISQQEMLLTELEAEVVDLNREIADFRVRYDRLVLPLETRLEAVQGAIADLEVEYRRTHGHPLGDDNPQRDFWRPPENYVSVEEQFKRAWSPPPVEEPESATRIMTRPTLDPRETNIKKLYRALARRYHPDLTTDPAERDSRNALMARINEAYAQRDLPALQALAAHPEDATPDQPLAAMRLQELRQINEQLASRITALKLERADLQHSDMMRLALDDKLARSRGYDLLAEMAAKLERDYNAAMIRMERLRRRG